MARKLGDTIVLDFTTHNPSTGAVSDADTTPTCEVFEDENDTAILAPTVTKRTNKTGDYRVSILASTGNGFEVGKSYNVIATATVNQIQAKARIGSFTIDGKRVSDLNDVAKTDIVSDGNAFVGANIDGKISDRPSLSQIEASTIIAKEATLTEVGAISLLTLKIQQNRWKITGNQMIIYDDDKVTPLITFDLKNQAGAPTMTEPYERVPI